MLAVPDLLTSLLERIKNNDPHLNFLNWKDRSITDGQMHQLLAALSSNIYITEIVLPATMHNHVSFPKIQKIVQKNKKAQQLLLVEQTITLSHGSRQNS